MGGDCPHLLHWGRPEGRHLRGRGQRQAGDDEEDLRPDGARAEAHLRHLPSGGAQAGSSTHVRSVSL